MSKSILFFATSLHQSGGAGYVEKQLVKAFINLGYKVYLAFARGIGAPIKGSAEKLTKHLSDKSIHVVVDCLLHNLRSNVVLKSLKPDIVWFMSSLPRSLVQEIRQLAQIYVYYHMLAPWYYEIRGYYRRYRWYDLSMLYLAMNKAISKIFTCDMNPFSITDKVSVNSKYMQLLAKRYWKKEVYVLSPPIHLDKLSNMSKGRNCRLDYVLCFGRISPEKRYEETLRAIAMTKTKPKVMIAGNLSGKSGVEYLKYLLRIAKLLGVSMEVVVNVSEEEKWKLFSEAMIYVHNARAEHFGITVVEAMALGTPVIVHRSGEPYFGITDRGHFGLVYNRVEELAKHIDELFIDKCLWLRYHNLALKRAHNYDYVAFIDRIRRLLKD